MKRIDATDEELQALVNLIDAGVRHLGINGANPAAVWAAKIQAAKEIDEPVTDIKPLSRPATEKF